MKGTCKRAVSLMLVLVLSLSLILNVSTEAATKRNYVKSMKVSKKSISLQSGKSTTLKATVKVKGSASKKIKITQSAVSKKVVKVRIVSTNKGVTKLKITGKNVTKKTKVTFTIRTKGKNKKSKTIRKKITVTVNPASSSSATTSTSAQNNTAAVTTYTVTFNSNGGSSVSTQTVVKGETATEPTAPTRSGYIFLGWYTDSACTNAYDFSTKVTENITLYAKWVSQNDNLYDDIIDLGDLENLESQGLIEVFYASDGSLSAIEGSFTEDTVNSAQDAADLLNKSSSLFGEDMEASAEDITIQVMESEDSSEYFYKYSPKIDDIPVLGDQIVIATNDSGDVSGLTSSYNDAIESVDTSADITESEAQNVATEALLEQEDIQTFLNQYVSEEVTEDEIEAAFLGELHFSISKLIFSASDNFTPFFAYAVHVTTEEAEEGDVDLTETSSVSETVVLDTLESQDSGEDDSLEPSLTMPPL